MNPILAYLANNPEVWMPYLIPPVLSLFAYLVAKLDALGPVGHALAEIARGLGLDAKKVGAGLLMIWKLARKPVALPIDEDAKTDPKGDAK